MARISKASAHEVAVKVTENLQKKIKTWKRVADNLPDLIFYIPKENNNMQLMVNIENITTKIKCLLTEDIILQKAVIIETGLVGQDEKREK